MAKSRSDARANYCHTMKLWEQLTIVTGTAKLRYIPQPRRITTTKLSCCWRKAPMRTSCPIRTFFCRVVAPTVCFCCLLAASAQLRSRSSQWRHAARSCASEQPQEDGGVAARSRGAVELPRLRCTRPAPHAFKSPAKHGTTSSSFFLLQAKCNNECHLDSSTQRSSEL